MIAWITFIVLLGCFLVFLFALCDRAGKSAEEKHRPEEPVEDKSYMRYPCPLDDDLQRYIIEVCKIKEVSPALVMAVIGAESQYNADAVGDHGESFGLMQIQPKWHSERMDRLGVYNLLDPKQNVLVGVDILAELLDKENGIEWALSYYSGNGGAECEYSEKVMSMAECLLEGAMICNG